MSLDGAGNYTRTNGTHTGATIWQQDRDADAAILASRHDTADQDIASAISTAIFKDGQQTLTANIPWAGFKITNLGAGSGRTDSIRLGQLQDGALVYAGTTGGSSNAFTASLTPAITAYVTGMTVSVKADRANTGASTFNLNSVAATDIRKYNGTTALAANDILSGQTYYLQYNGTFWILLNPSAPNVAALTSAGLITTATLTASGNVTLSGLTASKLVYTDGSKILTSTAPAISTFTPTVSASGSMTVSSTSVYAFRYFQLGPFVYFQMGVGFTLGGTADQYVNISEPVAGTAHNLNITFPCAANDGGGTGIADARWRYDGSNIIVFKAGLSNWSLGANAAVFIDGCYEI